MAEWIDFKELRSKLRFRDVLQRYNVKLNVKGAKANGFCPLPSHQGNRKSPSFSVQLERGIWQCFGCHARGNVLDFACRMEGFDPTNPHELRKAAVKLTETLGPGKPASMPEQKKVKEVQRDDARPVLINAPIDFELQSLDPDHPYLKDRGFSPETIEYFGLGFCNRGMLKGRVAIPLHDIQGRLLGYAGRLTKDENIDEQNPKYKFPGTRDRNGTLLEFHKSLILYNGHRIPKKVTDLIVVEGFASLWWLWQHGYKNAVAVMGSDCSEEQSILMLERVELNGRIWIMTDGDDAGIRCAEQILIRCAPYRFVRWAQLEDRQQPTDCTLNGLQTLFSI